MPDRTPWFPSAEDRRRLTEHLFYEVQTTFYLAEVIQTGAGTVLDISRRNAEIEAFAIHLRQLIDFFWGEHGHRTASKRDAFAADYFEADRWASVRPARPKILDDVLRRRVGWGVAHLTYDRGWVEPKDAWWDVPPLARALAPAVLCFVEHVDPEQFAPGWLGGMGHVAAMCLEQTTWVEDK